MFLRVLETFEQFASLPLAIREVVERQDMAAFNQVYQALSLQEHQAVDEILEILNIISKELETSEVIQSFESLLRAIAAIAAGEIVWQSEVDAALTDLEARGFKNFKNGVQRIWTGERDLEVLRGQMSELESALLHRVLEIIAEPRNRQKTLQERMTALPSAIRKALEQGDTAALKQAFEILPPEEQDTVRETGLMLEELSVPEQLFALLPTAIREAWEQGDETAFDQAFEALSSEEQQRVEKVMGYLESLDENTGAGSYTSDETDDIEGLEPFLKGIAAVAVGDTTEKGRIEGLLTTLEITGWPIKKIVQRIWAGERDIATLTKGLAERDTALVLRVLEIIAGG